MLALLAFVLAAPLAPVPARALSLALEAATPTESATPPTVSRPSAPLLVGGLFTFGASYGISLSIGALYYALVFPIACGLKHCDPDPWPSWLLVPVVGPLEAKDTSVGREFGSALHIGDAALQIGGLALIGVGFLLRHDEPVADAARWTIVPRVSLAAAGRASGFTLGRAF